MNEAKTGFAGKNITKPTKAEFMENRQKGKKVTEPIEAKPLIENQKSQNQSYLQTPYYKTASFTKIHLKNGLFTNLFVSVTRETPLLPKLNGGI